MTQIKEAPDRCALRHPTLGWYTGRASSPMEGLFSWDRGQAFIYSANGARMKKTTFPCFRECVVENMA